MGREQRSDAQTVQREQGTDNNNILVPVAESATLQETVRYAVQRVLDDDTDTTGRIHFVRVMPQRESTRTDTAWETDILDRVTIWAEEEAGDAVDRLQIETAVIGQDEYVFSPSDVANILHDAAAIDNIEHIILDPEYDPGTEMPMLRPLEAELNRYEDIDCDVAPVSRPVRRVSQLGPANWTSFLTTFGVAFVFYQILAGALSAFNVVTGGVTAVIAAATVSRLMFADQPTTATPGRIVRFLVYLPVLVYEIVVSNVRVAALILSPRMPIDPKMVRISPDVHRSLPLTILANSITLTPGTLTVRADGNNLLIHVLDPVSLDGLEEGGLERWVQYVFGDEGDTQ